MAGSNYPSQRPVFIQAPTPEDEARPADSYSPGQLGTVFPYKESTPGAIEKAYQLVQLDSAMTTLPTSGAVAWWRNATGYLVTTDVSDAGRGNIAGRFGTLANAIAVDQICCIQVKGPGAVQIQTSPTSAPDTSGKIVIPSATDAKADVLAAGSSATYPPLGKSAGFLSAGLAVVDLDPPRRA